MHIDSIIIVMITGSLRFALVQNGAMEGLAGCLNHTDTKVLSSATQGIALLGIDSSAREKVAQSLEYMQHYIMYGVLF